MKTTRLVVGIISMVLFVIVTLQSCVAGLGNAISNNGEVSGSAGVMLAVCMLIAGIVGVAVRKSKGGTITAAVFYAIGGIIGLANVGNYKDLAVWSWLSFIFAALFILTVIFDKKKADESANEETKE